MVSFNLANIPLSNLLLNILLQQISHTEDSLVDDYEAIYMKVTIK